MLHLPHYPSQFYVSVTQIGHQKRNMAWLPGATVHKLVVIKDGPELCVCVYVGSFWSLPLGSQMTAAIHEKRELQPFVTTTWANTHTSTVLWKALIRDTEGGLINMPQIQPPPKRAIHYICTHRLCPRWKKGFVSATAALAIFLIITTWIKLIVNQLRPLHLFLKMEGKPRVSTATV